MADQRISDLNAATSIADADLLTIVQSGTNKKVTFATLKSDVGTGLSITSGTYTPTLTNNTNISASTAYLCYYIRVGSVVTVSGRVDIDPTATGGVILYMSLPIASNFSASGHCAGTLASTQVYNEFGCINASGTDEATFNFTSTTTSNHEIYFTFTYRII